jgi:signal transduction histidine kinase/CheY-like chemotaxis protein
MKLILHFTILKSTITKLSLVLLLSFLIFIPKNILAQQETPLYRLQSAYILNFINYISWENEKDITTFRIAIVGEYPELINELKIGSKLVDIRFQDVYVETVSNYSSLTEFHLVYINSENSSSIHEISSVTRQSNTLLISYDNDNLHDVMINLRSDTDGKLRFELNKSNIVYEGLKMDNDILLLGGTELDVAVLLRETEDALVKEKKTLEEKTSQVLELKRSSEYQKKILEELQNSYQNNLRAYDSLAIKVKNGSLKLEQLKTEKENILEQSREGLRALQQLVTEKERQTSDLSNQIGQNKKYLSEQESKLSALGKNLVLKQNSMAELGEKVNTQKLFIWSLSLGGIITVILLIVILKLSRNRKKTNELLSVEKKKAEAANLAKSTFLANMSHEIRTPMNAVLGYAQILTRDETLTENQKKSISSIGKSGEHLLTLINDVLDMSKIEAGKIKILPVSFHLHNMITELKEMFRFKMEQKNLSFDIDINADVPSLILADENRIRQIIINILGNASKFTDEGFINLKVKMDNRLINISVEDSGPGIPSDKTELIFGAFDQTDSGMQTSGGTGLGLAISRQLARLMGGDITVESTLGKGSCFTYTFFYEKGDSAGIGMKSDERIVEKLADGQDEVRVLVVDDKEDNRNVARLTLEPIGFKVMEAENGIEAINICKDWKPKIILMDAVMPVMGGKEATEKIRTMECGKDVAIIVLSASVLDDEREDILESGVDAFVNKPFKDTELLEEIRHYSGIEYSYKERMESKEKAEKFSEKDINIKALPNELKKGILQAAIVGDISKLTKLVFEIEKTDVKLAQYIMKLSDDFELEKIQELFRD